VTNIYICSCCFNPEVFLDPEYVKNSPGINYMAKRRDDNEKGFFEIEIEDDLMDFSKENSPFFHNENGVLKLKHEFLISQGYYWEESGEDEEKYIEKKFKKLKKTNPNLDCKIVLTKTKSQNQDPSKISHSGWWYSPDQYPPSHLLGQKKKSKKNR